MGAADRDEFERPGLDGRAVFTSTLQTGRRRARWVGSGGTRSSLPAVQEEKESLLQAVTLWWIVRMHLMSPAFRRIARLFL
eukprot:5186250-Amphidinium_carterae.1